MSHFHSLAPPVNEKARPAAFVSTTNQPINIRPLPTLKRLTRTWERWDIRRKAKGWKTVKYLTNAIRFFCLSPFFYIPPPPIVWLPFRHRGRTRGPVTTLFTCSWLFSVRHWRVACLLPKEWWFDWAAMDSYIQGTITAVILNDRDWKRWRTLYKHVIPLRADGLKLSPMFH
jgi:hypothetical protein